MSNLTRREFLHLAAASGIGVTVLGAAGPARAGHAPAVGMGVLVDVARCVGCRSCEAACKAAHGFPEGASQDLGPESWTYVKTVHLGAPRAHMNLGGEGAGARTFKVQCMHCAQPACASACPVAALRKTPGGPVVYDADRCIGCRYCMQACPFQVPSYEWTRLAPFVKKCDMCAERVGRGEKPACVEACPVGAAEFGDREAMLAEARRRIHENPSYVKRIYGSEEAGGTSVLMISDVPFEKLGFITPPMSSLPTLTAGPLKETPVMVLVGGSLLAALYWITQRREEVAAAEKNGATPPLSAGPSNKERS